VIEIARKPSSDGIRCVLTVNGVASAESNLWTVSSAVAEVLARQRPTLACIISDLRALTSSLASTGAKGCATSGRNIAIALTDPEGVLSAIACGC
jgi:hypothetical protein